MRQLPPGLQAHLDTGATTLCQCWRITTRNGRVLGFTDHDRKITFDGVMFEPGTGFTGTAMEQSVGLSVDSQDVSGVLKSGGLEEADLASGVYDDAEISIWLVNWQEPAQRLLLRTGNLGEVTRGALAFTAEVRGLAHRLNQTHGRLFQYTCDAELGDVRCGVDVDEPAFSALAEVDVVTDGRRLTVTGLEGYPQGWFEQGLAVVQGGEGGGLQYRIRAHAADAVSVVLELDERPARSLQAGTILKVIAGCDKRFETCRAKFANAVNFRGFPHMPGDDFVIYYPNAGEGESDA